MYLIVMNIVRKMSMEEFVLDLFVTEEELMELDRDIRHMWMEGGLSREEEEFGELLLPTYKDCRIHWREYHQEYVSLYRCPVAGCLYSSTRRGQATRHGNFRHKSTVDPLPVIVENAKYRPPGDRLMPLAPVTTARDLFRKD